MEDAVPKGRASGRCWTVAPTPWGNDFSLVTRQDDGKPVFRRSSRLVAI
jgi:hypothetical protein